MEKVRPKLPDAITEGSLKEEELFQNMVLRPIIKMQHALLILRVRSYFSGKKVPFQTMDVKKRAQAVEQAFSGDPLLKKELQGMVLGQLSADEFKSYLKNEKAYNKRIVQMLRNRMLDSLMELVG
jgi:hypothetical protein